MMMEKKSCQDSEAADDKIAVTPSTSSHLKTEKICHICKQLKPIKDFYTAEGHNDGFQSRCIPCEKAYQKSRRGLYAERNKAYKIKWKQANKQKVLEQDRAYRANNPEIWAAKERRRRACLKNNGVFLVTKKELKKLYALNCVYCGAYGKMTIDHVLPIERGGSHSIGNLVPACGPCNFSKGKKLLIEWKLYKARKVEND